ncbi:hypothetical protein ACFL6K_00965 [Candidatus Latescibacterota bacterium]
MENTKIQNQIDDINSKLDIILEEIGKQRQQRRELVELRDDLLRVGKDVSRDVIDELEELSSSFEIKDAILLGKQLLRNINNLKTAFEQLESARDFIADFNSISGDLFNDVMLKFDEFDRKGYFELMKKGGETLDIIAAEFSPEDIDRLNKNIPRFASILKKLSKPELIEKIDTAVQVFDSYKYDSSKSAGPVKLISGAMSSEARTGMLYMLGLMRETVKSLNAETK